MVVIMRGESRCGCHLHSYGKQFGYFSLFCYIICDYMQDSAHHGYPLKHMVEYAHKVIPPLQV